MGTMIEFARPDGGKTKGYLTTAGQGRPGVVVIQEWWGLNDQICGVADRFARAGYNALAPDLYKSRLTTQPDEANHLMTGLDFADATHQDLRGAAQRLQAHGHAIAGTPAQVRDYIAAQVAAAGASYFVCDFAFGTIGHDEAMRSVALFAQEVMPAFAEA